MSVPSKAIDGVSVENANGETSSLPRVQKWSSEKNVIGNSIPSMNKYYLEAQKIRNVSKDNENGQFISLMAIVIRKSTIRRTQENMS